MNEKRVKLAFLGIQGELVEQHRVRNLFHSKSLGILGIHKSILMDGRWRFFEDTCNISFLYNLFKVSVHIEITSDYYLRA